MNYKPSIVRKPVEPIEHDAMSYESLDSNPSEMECTHCRRYGYFQVGDVRDVPVIAHCKDSGACRSTVSLQAHRNSIALMSDLGRHKDTRLGGEQGCLHQRPLLTWGVPRRSDLQVMVEEGEMAARRP